MNTNDVLRRLSYALQLPDSGIIELMAKGAPEIPVTSTSELAAWFLREEDPAYKPLPAIRLGALLDGLILHCRGPRNEGDSGTPPRTAGKLDNNQILKKVRVALSLQEQDILDIMQVSGITLSKSELSALFRKKDQRNYVECQDQFLRNFLTGLCAYRQAGKLPLWRGLAKPKTSEPTD